MALKLLDAFMDECKSLYEEIVRAKILIAWLADHGFRSSDISAEYSFEVCFGGKILLIDSEDTKENSSHVFRLDAGVLVLSHNDRNLLIVEVKVPSELLDEDI